MPDAKRGSELSGGGSWLPALRTGDCEYWWVLGGVGYKTFNKRESYARVLDYLPYGHPDDLRPAYQKKPLVQAIGEDRFVLMELSPKKNKNPEVYDQVYIGEGEREVIDHVVKRVKYKDLTPNAKEALLNVLEIIVKDGYKWFIQFFNKAHPNCFMLLSNVGTVKMWRIKEEREKSEFANFEDLKMRVEGIHHPEKILAKRIEEEIIGKVGYKLFVWDREKNLNELKKMKKLAEQEAYFERMGSKTRKKRKERSQQKT